MLTKVAGGRSAESTSIQEMMSGYEAFRQEEQSIAKAAMQDKMNIMEIARQETPNTKVNLATVLGNHSVTAAETPSRLCPCMWKQRNAGVQAVRGELL
jgi:hypothetical protein